MRTGSHPGGNAGFGMVTSRMVGLLYRTRPWARVIAFLSFLGFLALLAVAGLVRSQSGDGSPELVARGFAGLLAPAVLLLAVPLYRFARAVEQIVRSNQGPSVAAVFEHLESFWRRAGITGALFALALGVGGLFVVWRARSDARLAGFVASVLDPREAARREREGRQKQEFILEQVRFIQGPSPLLLKPARFGRSSPRRVSPPTSPKAPGRILTFDQINEACPAAAESFLCLLNHPGEEFGGGNRQVLTGADARFSIGTKRHYEDREYLEVVVERKGGVERKGKDVRLGLAPPEGFPLMKTMYTRASGFGSAPFLFVVLSSQSSCNRDGKFRVAELAWGADGLPDRLVVDFEQPCGLRPPLVGRLSIQG